MRFYSCYGVQVLANFNEKSSTLPNTKNLKEQTMNTIISHIHTTTMLLRVWL